MASYSQYTDLLHGDIPFPARFGNGQPMVDLVAKQMDAQLGQIYVTPIILTDTPVNRPATIVLNQINNLIASGRLLMDMAAAGEDTDLNRYGKSLFDEGMALLVKILDGSFPMPGAIPIDGNEAPPPKLIILQEDPESLVEGFYQAVCWGEDRTLGPPLAPYQSRPQYPHVVVQ